MTICEHRGPLYGVALRMDEDGKFFTRQFNTRPELGYCTEEYEGHYDIPTLAAGFRDYLVRVAETAGTVHGDLRERLNKRHYTYWAAEFERYREGEAVDIAVVKAAAESLRGS